MEKRNFCQEILTETPNDAPQNTNFIYDTTFGTRQWVENHKSPLLRFK
jgi:hypothetical protein